VVTEFTPRTTGLLAAGVLSLVIGLERFTNALLMDGFTSYGSTRFIVAVACTTTGGLLLVLGAVALISPRRRLRGGAHRAHRPKK
jgi:hypothetical protein